MLAALGYLADDRFTHEALTGQLLPVLPSKAQTTRVADNACA